jgi:hypothetical protein
MSRRIPALCIALAVLLGPAASQASTPVAPTADPLPALFVQFFYQWKSEPQDLRISDLKVLSSGGGLRVLCGAYLLPGQASRPFLVLGDATPTATAAWEPGSFPQGDPLYPQLMDNLRLCQTLGVAVTSSQWGEAPTAKPVPPQV